MTSSAIAVSGLRKAYGDKVVLDGIDFDVAAGSVFSLLGPNGAGKTTTVNVLTTLMKADGGTVRVAGHDVATEAKAVRAAIGVTGQFAAVDELLTGRENLQLMVDLNRASSGNDRRIVTELLERFDLVESAQQPASTYSGGMRRKLDLAMTLVGNPRIIFLDEPTTGLDPRSRRTMWSIIRDLVADGVTIFLTTHYLEEAEQLCDRIAIINHGRLIANEPTRALVNMAQEKVVEVTVDRDLAAAPQASLFDKIEFDGERTLTITYRKDRANAGQVLDVLQSEGLGIVEVSTREPDLEDVFLNLTRATGADG